MSALGELKKDIAETGTIGKSNARSTSFRLFILRTTRPKHSFLSADSVWKLCRLQSVACKKTSVCLAATTPHDVHPGRTGLVPSLQTGVPIKNATTQFWSLVAGTRSQAGLTIDKICTMFGNCCTPLCGTRQTKSSLSLGRAKKKNVSIYTRAYLFVF